MRSYLLCISSLLLISLLPSPAHAGDAVTLMFREGQVARIDYGYKQIVEAFKRLATKGDEHRILELSVEGGSFLVDLSQVVIVCRDKCNALDVSDPRQSKK